MSDEADGASEPQLIDALHRVYVDSLPDAQRSAILERTSDAVKGLDTATALQIIDDSDLDRLHKWHVVASAVHRRPDLVENQDINNGLIDAITPEFDPNDDERSNIADGLAAFTQQQSDPTVPLSKDRWTYFYDNVLGGQGGLRGNATEHDADKPGCNDAPSDAGVPTVISRFWTSKTLDEMRPYVDPRNWPQLGSQYWEDMSPIEGPTWRPDGYDAVFREVVKLPTGKIKVYLDVNFQFGPDFALTTYRESSSHQNDDVRFDRGYVFATNTTQGLVPQQTLVYSTKSIIFTDEDLNWFTDIACDNGWVDLMIHMALPRGRSKEIGAQGLAAAAAPPSEVELWAATVHKLIDRCVARTRYAVDAVGDGRFDLELLDELLTVGDDVTASVNQGAKALREVLGQLADAGGRR